VSQVKLMTPGPGSFLHRRKWNYFQVGIKEGSPGTIQGNIYRVIKTKLGKAKMQAEVFFWLKNAGLVEGIK